MSILYVLMAVVIFLALLAALGAWVRGGGLKREDAENLFSDSQERHREEISRLEKVVAETRMAAEQAQMKAAEAMTLKLADVESAVSRAASEHSEALSEELELVTRRLSESENRVKTNIDGVNTMLGTLQDQVNRAGDQMREALIEINRQQQDQKAQSTIQMCEALITSLGTLKSSISNQLTQETSAQTVEASTIEETDAIDEAPEFQVSDTEHQNQAEEPINESR